MSKKDLIILDIINEIEKSLELIIKRFSNIKNSSDFMKNEDNLILLDSISMRLLAIGEGFKQIDKLTDMILVSRYPDINWKDIKGMRDILSHHYFDLDAEIVYETCDNEIALLLAVVKDFKSFMKNTSR